MPAEDAELADLIAVGLAITEELEAATRRLTAVKARFVDIANARREGRASVSLEGLYGGVGRCTWSSEKKLDQPQVKALREEMQAAGHGELFDGLFDEETVYRLRRAAPKFIASAGPALDPYLKAIGTAIQVKPKSPSVRFLGNAESAIEGGDEGDDA